MQRVKKNISASGLGGGCARGSFPMLKQWVEGGTVYSAITWTSPWKPLLLDLRKWMENWIQIAATVSPRHRAENTLYKT